MFWARARLHDFFDAGVLAALGDEDAVEGAAGFEGFANGVNAGETIHGGEFTVESLKLKVWERREERDLTQRTQRWDREVTEILG